MARRERAASDRRAWVARGGARAAQRLRGLDPAADPSARPAAGAVLAALQPAAQGELGFATAPEAAELWIALHLPALVVEAVASPPPPSGRALVVFDGEAALPRVLAVDAAARDCGIAPGLSLTAALALSPTLEARPRDPRRERAWLARVADAAFGFTPRVSLEPPDGVLLEVRGSLGLFGGASALCAAVMQA